MKTRRCYNDRVATSTIAKIDKLEKLYRVPGGDKLKAYLTGRPDVLDILIEAYPHLERQFGPNAVVELRFLRAYESDYEGDLLAMVQSQAEAHTALDRFDKFWDEWSGDASASRASWPICIGVEYSGEYSR
jgi:hypothetical protein